MEYGCDVLGREGLVRDHKQAQNATANRRHAGALEVTAHTADEVLKLGSQLQA